MLLSIVLQPRFHMLVATKVSHLELLSLSLSRQQSFEGHGEEAVFPSSTFDDQHATSTLQPACRGAHLPLPTVNSMPAGCNPECPHRLRTFQVTRPRRPPNWLQGRKIARSLARSLSVG